MSDVPIPVPFGSQRDNELLKNIAENTESLALHGAGLPDQTGHANEYLATDGTTADWLPLGPIAALLIPNNLADVADGPTSLANIGGEPLLVNSAGLAAAINDETGTNKVVFSDDATLARPSFTGVRTQTGVPVTAGNALGGGTVIDVTRELNTKTIAAATVFTFSGVPANTNQWFGLYITNSDAANAYVMTIPSSFSLNRGAAITTFTIPASGQVFLQWRWDGAAYEVTGDPVSIADLSAATAAAADSMEFYDATDGKSKKGTIPEIMAAGGLVHTVSFSLTGAGVAITTGIKYPPVKALVTGTVLGWTCTAQPSATISFDLYRTANTAGLPVASMIGAGTKPGMTGVEIASTDLTNWPSPTTITAFDNLCPYVIANDNATTATLTVYYR